MGLYLAVFDDGIELDGVEVGSYADFNYLRESVVKYMENGIAGSRLPTLMLHSDCDGQWTPAEAGSLELELTEIGTRFKSLPPIPLNSDWQREVAKLLSIQPLSLYDCFFDVDGESLLERMIGLARLSQTTNLPILFQ